MAGVAYTLERCAIAAYNLGPPIASNDATWHYEPRMVVRRVLNEKGERVPYWTTVPPMTKEEWRWRIIEAYKEDMNASYNKIADKAHVSFARVKRWLPVYQRTGCVFDDTKPGPVPTPWHITEPRPPRLIPNSHYKRQERLKGKWIPHPVSKVGSDKHHRIHARERMGQVYKKNKTASVTTLLLRRPE